MEKRIKKAEEIAERIILKVKTGHMIKFFSDLDENIIQRCIDPYYYSGYSGYSGYSDYSPPPHREAAITETNYINLLNELKRESSENCPAVNFANDEKNVPTYEKLCSRSSDPKEKKKKP